MNYLCRVKQFKRNFRLLLLLLATSTFFISCKDECRRIEALPFRIEKEGKWGLMSTRGEIILPAIAFDNCPSCVVNGMFTVPDKDGRLQLYSIEHPETPVTPRRFYRLGYFFEEVTFAQESPYSSIIMINKMGQNIFSTEQQIQYRIGLMNNFSNGRALFVTREGKYGYLDTQ
ncbi:MAG: hypothetical protein Q4A54_07905, partial [Parabacteroides sp.]|nr:hypothetical protein [Parabacteroides sp.]